MSLSLITHPGAVPAAVQFFSDADVLALLLPSEVTPFNCERTLLGILNLFSTCRGIQKFALLLIPWLKSLLPQSPITECFGVCWGRMEGVSIGQHAMLMRNFLSSGSVSRLRFRVTEPSEVSTPPVDLSRPVSGELLYQGGTWELPLSPMATRITGYVRGYLETGQLYNLNKLGFFSTVDNRLILLRVMAMMSEELLADEFRRFHHRVSVLERLLNYSYGVVDLTPELTDAGGNFFDFWPLPTKFHIGVNPRGREFYRFTYFDDLLFTSISFSPVHRLTN
jgi:hypothetical protein